MLQVGGELVSCTVDCTLVDKLYCYCVDCI